MLRTLLLIVLSVCAFAPAVAHHSRAAYDLTREVTVEGTVARLDWKNPHIFMTVETADPDGERYPLEIEVASVSEARVLGLTQEAISPGARVVVRAHPGRRGPRTRAVGLAVTASDGTVYPLNVDARLAIRPAAVEARGIEGRWAPTIESFRDVVPAMQSWPLTEKGRAAAETAANTSDSRSITLLGICEPLPPPVLAVFTDLRTIEVRDATVAMRFEGGVGVTMERVIRLNEQHPPNVQPSLMGHSIGRWEGETLVIDTVAFAPHPVGVMFLPSGPNKHLVERLTLTADRLRLEYAVTLTDPEILAAPASYTAIWDHRPDLEPSGEPCDPEVARRALAESPN